MKNIKVGIIGLGFMGTTHLGIYRKLPGVQVTAIADVDPAKRSGDISSVVCNIGGTDNSKKLDLSGMAVYEDALEMIRKSDTDIIDICVPTPEHKKYIMESLKAGKHVFSEKPLCRNLSEMKEISEAVAVSGKFFNVGMCVRAWPEYVHARETYLSGRAGKLKTALFRRFSPTIKGNSWNDWFMKEKNSGGAMLDFHLHDTDAVCYFFGRPKSVTSFGARGLATDTGIDQVVTRYDYGDGTLITAEGGWAAAKQVPFEMSFLLICEKATIKLDSSGYHIYWTDGRTETPNVVNPELPTGWHQELDYFVKCVRDGVEPTRYQTHDQIFDSFRVVFAEMESVDTEKKVKVKYV